jgi:hypothetical protein
MALGLERDKVSLRNIWREHRKAPLRPQFEALENLPLRGLYWLSRDLFEDTLEDVLEPDARALHAIRNHLEHKYLKIHEMLVRRSSTDRSPFDPFTDTLAHSIARSEFSDKTLRLLKLSRAALIYLSLGMHWEERRRRKERGDAASFPVELDRWDDAWKT